VCTHERRDARRLVRIDAAFDALVARHLETDHEVIAAGRPIAANLRDEAHAIFQRAAVRVGALVDHARICEIR
jgi:hypothetical protein